MIKIGPLSESEVRALKKLTRKAVGRVALRAYMVLASHRGYSIQQIARFLDSDPDTVRHWLERYQDEGVKGLQDRPRLGRPPKLGEAAQNEIKTQVDQASPQTLGYVFTCWCAVTLAFHLLCKLNISVSPDTVRHWLHRLGYVFARPKHFIPYLDPEKAKKWAAIARAIWDSPDDAVILSGDESICRWFAPLRAMWMKRGEQRQIPVPPKNGKRVIFGALNLATGAFHYLIRPRQTAAAFIELLEELIQMYGSRPILLIVDNGSAHTAKVVKAWLTEHPTVSILYLPKRSPKLNPIEKVWWHMKNKVTANRLYETLEDLEIALHRFLSSLSSEDVLRLAA